MKKSSLYEAYETDHKLEEEGAWVEIRDGVEFRIRSDQSSPVREFAAKLGKAQRQILQANGWVLPPKMSDRNDVLLCRTVLVTGWRMKQEDGSYKDVMLDRDGQELPFSPDNVEKLVSDLPALRRDILMIAKTDETYKAVRESMLGNSATSSAAN
jgi:hypothetical protein